MKVKNIKNNSSKQLNNFLESSKLHKKDFAEMIGVTLSLNFKFILLFGFEE